MRKRYSSLAAYMRATGMTQAKLAKAVGVSQGQISQYVNGKLIPRPAAAIRLSEYTGVPIGAFVRARAQQKESVA